MVLLALLPMKTRITFIAKGEFRVIITAALLKVELYNFSDGGGEGSFALARRIFARILRLAGHSTLTVEELKVPKIGASELTPSAYILPYCYHAVISATIAYLRSNTEKLNIRDNAIILIPDGEGGFSLLLSARVGFFFVLCTVLQIIRDQRSQKRKEVKKNVGD